MAAQHLSLFIDFTRRDIESRYRKSHLGLVWMVLTPILTLAVYAFAFSVILGVHRMVGDGDGPLQYVIMLFSGLIVFFFVSEVLSACPEMIAKKANFVKKVVFPLPVLVGSKVLSCTVTFLVNIVILLVFIAALNDSVPVTAFYLPLIILPSVLMMLGIAFTLSAVSVYLPDIGQIMTPMLRMLFYLTPIVYPLSVIPQQYQAYFWLNPMTSMVAHLRTVLLEGQPPDLFALAWFYLAAIGIAVIGYWVFKRLRNGFADVV